MNSGNRILLSCLITVVLSGSLAAPFYEESTAFLQNVVETLQKHQKTISITALCAATISYMAYAVYLDLSSNDKQSICQWALSSVQKNNSLDDETLMLYMQERYPELARFNPLATFFALGHDLELEIETCLSLRSILKNLTLVGLGGIVHQTILQIDRKLEHLYTIKMVLAECTTQTRTQCKKKAGLC